MSDIKSRYFINTKHNLNYFLTLLFYFVFFLFLVRQSVNSLAGTEFFDLSEVEETAGVCGIELRGGQEECV